MKTPCHQVEGFTASRSEAPLLGPMPVDLPDGAGHHLGIQCQSATTMHAAHVAGTFVVIFLGMPVPAEMAGLGFYLPMTADDARAFAERLLATADLVDGGRGKQ